MRFYRGMAGLIGWFALVLQYVLIVQAVPEGPAFATVNFFSYFTILSNLLVALALALPVVAPRAQATAFFLRPGVRTAIALYIAVTGLIYAFVLQSVWSPQGCPSLPTSCSITPCRSSICSTGTYSWIARGCAGQASGAG